MKDFVAILEGRSRPAYTDSKRDVRRFAARFASIAGAPVNVYGPGRELVATVAPSDAREPPRFTAMPSILERLIASADGSDLPRTPVDRIFDQQVGSGQSFEKFLLFAGPDRTGAQVATIEPLDPSVGGGPRRVRLRWADGSEETFDSVGQAHFEGLAWIALAIDSRHEGGEVSGPEEQARVHEFIDDDAGYLAWVVENPTGYVVNCERQPSPGYLKLHVASCDSISTDRYGNYTTAQYKKVCSTDRGVLDVWADYEIGGVLQPCGTCMG